VNKEKNGGNPPCICKIAQMDVDVDGDLPPLLQRLTHIRVIFPP
jgi:hypothetical protein